MTQLLKKPDVAQFLGIGETSIDEQRKIKQFPEPLVCSRWSHAQLDDYISQLEAHGGWNQDRYIKAMEARRARIAG